ncbi:MAG: hypothetical protein R2909_22460 [Gemmatimonadales bacterium]
MGTGYVVDILDQRHGLKRLGGDYPKAVCVSAVVAAEHVLMVRHGVLPTLARSVLVAVLAGPVNWHAGRGGRFVVYLAIAQKAKRRLKHAAQQKGGHRQQA